MIDEQIKKEKKKRPDLCTEIRISFLLFSSIVLFVSLMVRLFLFLCLLVCLNSRKIVGRNKCLIVDLITKDIQNLDETMAVSWLELPWFLS